MLKEITYTIGQVSALLNMPSSTIRYYDKKELLPNLAKNEIGIRIFTQSDIDTLRVIECLKKSGMKIDDIHTFINLTAQGDDTIEQRREMFYQIREDFTKQMAQMEETMRIINFKCSYYDQASEDGTEENVHKERPLSRVVPLKDAE